MGHIDAIRFLKQGHIDASNAKRPRSADIWVKVTQVNWVTLTLLTKTRVKVTRSTCKRSTAGGMVNTERANLGFFS